MSLDVVDAPNPDCARDRRETTADPRILTRSACEVRRTIHAEDTSLALRVSFLSHRSALPAIPTRTIEESSHVHLASIDWQGRLARRETKPFPRRNGRVTLRRG